MARFHVDHVDMCGFSVDTVHTKKKNSETKTASAFRFVQVHALQEDYKSAIDVYTEAWDPQRFWDWLMSFWAVDVFTQALEFSPEHAELLTTLGILYLRCLGRMKASKFSFCFTYYFTTCQKDLIPKDGRELQGLCGLACLSIWKMFCCSATPLAFPAAPRIIWEMPWHMIRRMPKQFWQLDPSSRREDTWFLNSELNSNSNCKVISDLKYQWVEHGKTERRRTTRIWMSLWSSIVWLRFTRQILLSFGTSPQLSFAQGGGLCWIWMNLDEFGFFFLKRLKIEDLIHTKLILPGVGS